MSHLIRPINAAAFCTVLQWISACKGPTLLNQEDSLGTESTASDDKSTTSAEKSSDFSFSFEDETSDVYPSDWTMTTHECADSSSTLSDPIVPGTDASSELSALCTLAEGIDIVYQRGANSGSDGLPEILWDHPSGWFACTNPAVPHLVRPHCVRINTVDCVSDHGRPGCMADSECKADEMCVCAGEVPEGESAVIDAVFDVNGGGGSYQFNGLANSCLRSKCQEGCGGFGCAISVDNCMQQVGAFCHTARDECRIHDECATKVPGICAYDEECGYWRCIDYWICE